MDAICYVCNEQSSELQQNFIEIKSQYTQVPISQFIRKFLGDFESMRNIDDESNCICAECLWQIDDYDLMCQQLTEQEKKIRDLLLGTEIKCMDIKVEPIDANAPSIISETCIAEIDPIAIKTEPEHVNFTLNPVLKTEPIPEAIIARQGENLMKIHLVKSGSSAAQPIDPLTIKNLPIGSLIKSKDEKIHRFKMVSKTTVNSVPTIVGVTSVATVNIPAVVSEQPIEIQPNGMQRTCDMCGKIFVNKKLLIRHMKAHKKTCNICDVRFKTENRLIKHMEWHKSHPGFVCSVCLFELNDKTSYKEHMELHESKASPFDCVLCDRTFAKKHRLRGHVIHHAIPNELCDLCGRKFLSRRHLTVHRKVHFDDMPYECEHCSKRFKWKRGLEAHMVTHNTQRDRPFACLFCGMRFLRVDHCSVHESISA